MVLGGGYPGGAEMWSTYRVAVTWCSTRSIVRTIDAAIGTQSLTVRHHNTQMEWCSTRSIVGTATCIDLVLHVSGAHPHDQVLALPDGESSLFLVVDGS